MARYAYERLSAQDASFLWAESEHGPMHVSAVAVLEAGPLRGENGGIDIERYRAAIESVLHWIPRYRQKLMWTPVEGWPVWVDDRYFDLGYHIRHVSLPQPGTREQLKDLAARILARHLDRSRPLWEIWVIEGLEEGEQFATLNKTHHCMIDGAAGADLSTILMSPSPRIDLGEPLPYIPRPAPSKLELMTDSLLHRANLPIGLLKQLGAGDSDEGPTLRKRFESLGEMMQFALHPSSDTPINGDLSPHRRMEWLTMPLRDVKELRKVLDCTINDIVLATVSGAMRRYLFRRRLDVNKIDFRVAAPVSTRKAGDDPRQGNHVSSWIVELPIGIDDPLDQVKAIRARTQALKESEASLAVDTVMAAAEWMPPIVFSAGASLMSGPANMIVTNVPGPQFPLFMVGAPLLGIYPMVPLLPGGGLGIALFSYDGKLCWGFNADYELVPDLETFVQDLKIAFERLRTSAVSHYVAARTKEAPAPAAVEVEKKARSAAPNSKGPEEPEAESDAPGPAQDDRSRTVKRVRRKRTAKKKTGVSVQPAVTSEAPGGAESSRAS
jgi:diacylglycerol O-acyltransferase